MRLIAIGDIHGHRKKLDDLLEQIQPCEEDQFVFLGDYIDRGPDSKGVIEDLIDFQLFYPKTVFLRGNHEQLMIDTLIDCGVIEGTPLYSMSPEWARETRYSSDAMLFLLNGGDKTMKGYNAEIARDGTKFTLLGSLPENHIEFLTSTKLYHHQDGFLFVHAGADEQLSLDEQVYTLLWDRHAPPGVNEIHVVGHVPCPGAEPYFEQTRYSLDTGSGHGRLLTACDVLTRNYWQAG
ncbi:MAG: metallophosphoesterase [Bacteroidales bacterium]|nr:metallophosphoesterase [Bacteroidales bacterium]